MDIVEYAEKFYGTNLPNWQKDHLRKVYEISRDNDIHVVFGRYGRVYTYLTPKTLKELIQSGKTANSSC